MSQREKVGLSRRSPNPLDCPAIWMRLGASHQPTIVPVWRANWSILTRVVPSDITADALIPGVSFQSRLHGVAQAAIVIAAYASVAPDPLPFLCFAFSRARLSPSARTFEPNSTADGVGHEENPLPLVRRADARSAQIGGPHGISRSLQVTAHSGDPFEPSRARNLLCKEHWRSALGDEPEKSGPKMPWIMFASSRTGGAERLAGRRSSPDLQVVGPPGPFQSEGPAAQAREEMVVPTLFGESRRFDFLNGPAIHDSTREDAIVDHRPDRDAGGRVVIVVVGHFLVLPALLAPSRGRVMPAHARRPRETRAAPVRARAGGTEAEESATLARPPGVALRRIKRSNVHRLKVVVMSADSTCLDQVALLTRPVPHMQIPFAIRFTGPVVVNEAPETCAKGRRSRQGPFCEVDPGGSRLVKECDRPDGGA